MKPSDRLRELNARIDAEVGVDDGSFLPLQDGTWYFRSAQERYSGSR